MTLNTEIYLHGQVDIPEFFEFCQRALLAFDGQSRRLDQIIWHDKDSYWNDGSRCRANKIGQNLPAILEVTYRSDGPLLTVEGAAEHNDYCNEDGDCDRSSHKPPHWARISLDTAYGYRDPHRNWNCGDLHAALIRIFGGYLDTRDVPFSWENEYTGEVHDGYNNLDGLGAGGANASAWFSNTVLPLIKMEMLERPVEGT